MIEEIDGGNRTTTTITVMAKKEENEVNPILYNPVVRFFLGIFFELPTKPAKALPAPAERQLTVEELMVQKNRAIIQNCNDILSKLTHFHAVTKGTKYEKQFEEIIEKTKAVYDKVKEKSPNDLSKIQSFNNYYSTSFVNLFELALRELEDIKEESYRKIVAEERKQAIERQAKIDAIEREEKRKRQEEQDRLLEERRKQLAEEKRVREEKLEQQREEERQRKVQLQKEIADKKLAALSTVRISSVSITYSFEGLKQSVSAHSSITDKQRFLNSFNKQLGTAMTEYIGNSDRKQPIFKTKDKFYTIHFSHTDNKYKLMEVQVADSGMENGKSPANRTSQTTSDLYSSLYE